MGVGRSGNCLILKLSCRTHFAPWPAKASSMNTFKHFQTGTVPLMLMRCRSQIAGRRLELTDNAGTTLVADSSAGVHRSASGVARGFESQVAQAQTVGVLRLEPVDDAQEERCSVLRRERSHFCHVAFEQPRQPTATRREGDECRKVANAPATAGFLEQNARKGRADVRTRAGDNDDGRLREGDYRIASTRGSLRQLRATLSTSAPRCCRIA